MKILEFIEYNIMFKKNKVKIVNDLSFTIEKGDFIQVKGPNGSGKSTLLKSIIKQQSNKYVVTGQLHFNGKDIAGYRKSSEIFNLRSRISYVPQIDDYSGYKSYSALKVVRDSALAYTGSSKRSIDDIMKIFDGFRFNSSNEKIKFSPESPPNKLSPGQQRALTIIAGIYARPFAELYIIDEPLNHLDEENEKQVIAIIENINKKQSDSAIILVSHKDSFKGVNKIINII